MAFSEIRVPLIKTFTNTNLTTLETDINTYIQSFDGMRESPILHIKMEIRDTESITGSKNYSWRCSSCGEYCCSINWSGSGSTTTAVTYFAVVQVDKILDLGDAILTAQYVNYQDVHFVAPEAPQVEFFTNTSLTNMETDINTFLQQFTGRRENSLERVQILIKPVRTTKVTASIAASVATQTTSTLSWNAIVVYPLNTFT